MALILSTSLLFLAGCTAGFQPGEEAYYTMLDYRIDRARVMALSVTPTDFSSGATLTFRAMAATPTTPINPRVEWWGCGISLEVPVYGDSDCLTTAYAEYLGDGATFHYTMPIYDTSTCDAEYGCYGWIPVFAVVRDEAGNAADDGYASIELSPDYLDVYDPPPYDLDKAHVRFTLDGGTSAVSVPGGRVPLEVQVDTFTETDLSFRWYVTTGDLEQYGLTRAAQTTPGMEGAPNLVVGRNTLVVPEDFEGDRIQVYVVIDLASTTSYYFVPYTAEQFASGTVEVR